MIKNLYIILKRFLSELDSNRSISSIENIEFINALYYAHGESQYLKRKYKPKKIVKYYVPKMKTANKNGRVHWDWYLNSKYKKGL